MRGAAAVATTVFGLTGPALAQRANARPVTELSFSLEDRHDSNIARLDGQRASARGLTLSDQRTTPSVQLTIARPFGRNTLALHAEAGYDFYRHNTQLNRERLTFGGRTSLVGGPCQLTLTPTFSRRQSDLADLAIVTVPGVDGVDGVRNVQTVQDYGGELRCGWAYGLRPLVGIHYASGDNSSSRRSISDYRTTRYETGLGYGNPVLGDFALRFAREETYYPKRPVAIGRGGFSVGRVELTGERALGAVLTASGGLSYLRLQPDGTNVGRFSGVAWNLALSAVPVPDLRLVANLSRDVTPSLGTDALYLVGRTTGLSASYAVNRQLSFGVSGTLAHRRYAGAGTTYGPALTDSNQRTVTGTVSLASSRRLGFSIEVGHQSRDANGVIYDYHDFFAALRTKFTL